MKNNLGIFARNEFAPDIDAAIIPEMSLYYAMFIQLVKDLRLSDETCKDIKERNRIRKRALAYVYEEYTKRPAYKGIKFALLCQILDIDPEYARKKMIQSGAIPTSDIPPSFRIRQTRTKTVKHPLDR